MIKFMKHYVTNGTDKARVYYSKAVLTNGRDCVTLYAKDYSDNLSKIFSANEYENDSDSLSDYFEKGRVRIYSDNPLFNLAAEKAN